ncbi:MAG: phosphotransferase [Bacteroides sp.]|nr:phosphotransferase [Roseburia sp.]MCM1347441.1 phosphotransferase [Bacteroides sp.]MCM1421210.1 phosphotransferase [Bacteroides sp.]
MERLRFLCRSVWGAEPDSIERIKGAGSNRLYYRMTKDDDTMIGVIGTSAEENRAFCLLAKWFAECGISVPAVYAVSDDGICYIQEDLGRESLFDFLSNGRNNGGAYNEDEKKMLHLVISKLPKIQFEGASDDVFRHCYPSNEMDETGIMFDFNYFKYCFLKPVGVEFNEYKLERDFRLFAQDLLADSTDTFMYRDFQARNVMLKGGTPYFIDFQGGRRGPIYYDVASFLWQASALYSASLREELIDTYLAALACYCNIEKGVFMQRLHLFVLFRTLQVLGAYGFRGLWEKKKHFVDSIPYAMDNLHNLVEMGCCDKYAELKAILESLLKSENPVLKKKHKSVANELVNADSTYCKPADKPLVVRVFSFAYKNGIPEDTSGNGGGYVFDCRSTHNPGRYPQYKQLTGLDKPVIDFLEEDGEILSFLESVYRLADFHVARFIERGFTNLMFSCGCTGGQHRSVYSAQHLAEHIRERFGIEVILCHRELKK